MRKLILIASTVTMMSALSTFGQGYFIFSGNAGFVQGPSFPWQGTTRVAFLWGSGTPLVNALAPAISTNGTPVLSRSVAWDCILADPNFHLALNDTDGSLVSVLSAANGAWSYSMGATFPVTGAAPGAWQVYVIGWDYNYATPAAAQTAGALLGWSGVFTYNAVNQIDLPLSMPQSGLQPFGIAQIPEPGALTLAGLVAGVSFLRRRAERAQTSGISRASLLRHGAAGSW